MALKPEHKYTKEYRSTDQKLKIFLKNYRNYKEAIRDVMRIYYNYNKKPIVTEYDAIDLLKQIFGTKRIQKKFKNISATEIFTLLKSFKKITETN